VTLQGERDLFRSQHQAARRVDEKVNGHVLGGEADRPEDLLGILDVNVSSDGKAEEAHGLLAMDHRDETRLASLLETVERPVPPELEHLLPVQRYKELREHEKPDEPGQVHAPPECALRDRDVVSYSSNGWPLHTR